jgi:membrane carboxypeptidase/penicillin-binding protein
MTAGRSHGRRLNISFSLRRSRLSRLLVLAGFAVLTGALIYGSYAVIQVALFDPEPYISSAGSRSPDRIYDRNGRLISELFSIKTGTLKFEEIPRPMIDTLLFVEDEDFYSHGAIDFTATLRAIFINILNTGFIQGASTITQQFARILLNDREKTLSRKLKEASLAYALEARYSKNEILTGYFNHVYLGHGAYGFETAADFYFKKKLADLNFTERLILASLPSAPEKFSPLRNPELLIRKMDHIYRRMVKDGFPVPSQSEYEAQKRSSLMHLNRSPTETVFGTRIDYGPYVTEYVRSKLREILGEESESQSGLRIETTIDIDLQKSAVKQSRDFLAEVRNQHPYRRPEQDDESVLKERITREYLLMALGGAMFGLPVPRTGNKRLETASIGLDPKTGEILFMQGGSEFFPENQLNRAIQMRRQTGSAIKPIIYSAGVETGKVNPATPLEDSPIFFSGVKSADGRDFWLPDNIDEDYEGIIPARVALARSRNIPAIRAAMIIGLDRVGEQFRKFFFHTDEVFSKRFRAEQGVAIGILEMSPLEMASAFSAFANNGVIKRPYLIRRITDPSGRILFEGTGKDEFNLQMPPEVKAIDGDAAEVVASMLLDSAKYGGAGRGGLHSRLLLGKTGTTNKYRDAWFVGVLPGLSAAVWVGFDNHIVSMNKGTGAGLAGPLFGRIVSGSGKLAELENDGYTFDPRARSVTVCADTGLLPNGFCPRKKTELFAAAGVPDRVCDKHGRDTVENPSLPDLPTKSDFD